jgi:hypothetical protein
MSAGNIGLGRNKVINGDFRMDQRFAGSNAAAAGSMTATAASTAYGPDRFAVATGPASGSLCAQQVGLSAADQIAIGGGNGKAVQLSPVPTAGLTTYIPFDGYSVADVMGTATSPVIGGTASYSTGKVGTVAADYTVNSSGGSPSAYVYYTLPSSMGWIYDLTFSFWMYTTALPGSGQATPFGFSNGSDGAGPYVCIQSNTTGMLTWAIYSSSTASYTVDSAAGAIVANTWHHITGTFTAGIAKLFINGTQVGATSINGALSISTAAAITRLYIGARVSTGVYGFKGYIDDVRIYNRALSASEVSALANNVGQPIPPSIGFTEPTDFMTRLTFDNTIADATGALVQTSSANIVYSSSAAVGTACLDFSANVGNGGATSYVTYTTPLLSISSGFTITGWFNPANNIDTNTMISLTSGASSYGFELQTNTTATTNGASCPPGCLNAGISGVGYYFTSSIKCIVANAWHHIALVFSNPNLCVAYVNGILVASGSCGSSYTWSFLPIGAMHQNSYSYKGLQDETRIYNRALTVAEIALLAGNVSIPTLPATTNLKALLAFDGNTADSSVSNLTSTITGSVSYSASIVKTGSQSIYFNNTISPQTAPAHFVLTPNPVHPTILPFTFCFWARTTDSAQNQTVVGLCDSSFVGGGIQCDIIGGASSYLTAYCALPSNWSPVSTPAGSITTNTWFHIAISVSTSYTATLYLNGIHQGSVTGTGTIPRATQFIIGGSGDKGRGFNGYIDDFRVYDKVLGAGDILAISGRQNLATQLTFDNTTADAIGTLLAPTVTGTLAYSTNSKTGSAALDLTANTAASSSRAVGLDYSCPQLSYPFTVSVWLNPSVNNVNYPIPICFGTSTSRVFQFTMVSTGQVYVEGCGGVASYTLSSAILPVNTWSHVVCTVVSTGFNALYINGNLIMTTAVSNQTMLNINQLRFGAPLNQGDSTTYKGLIDDVRIYNSALTPSQVAGIYYSSQRSAYVLYQQPIEALNLADLAWGTSAALPATVSAWIKNNTATAQQLTLAVNNANQNIVTQHILNGNYADSFNVTNNLYASGTVSISSAQVKVGATSALVSGNVPGAVSTSYLGNTSFTYTGNTITMMCWFNTTEFIANITWVYLQSIGTAGNGLVLYLTKSDSSLLLRANGSTNTLGAAGGNGVNSSAISAGWNHGAATWDGTNLYLYLNGVYQGSTAFAGTSLYDNKGYFLAGYTNVTDSRNLYTSFNGYINDARLYNKVLTAAQIAQIYNNNALSTTIVPYLLPRSVIYTTPSIPANAWSKVAFTIPGDTLGTWAQGGNTTGLTLSMCLGAGTNYASSNVAAASNNSSNVWNTVPAYTGASNQIFGSSSNNFLANLNNSLLITGVQLEKGTMATPFESRPFQTELQLCQRYYQKVNNFHLGITINGSYGYNATLPLRTTMRALPSLESGGTFTMQSGSTGTVAIANSTPDAVTVYNSAANWTNVIQGSANLAVNAEL